MRKNSIIWEKYLFSKPRMMMQLRLKKLYWRICKKLTCEWIKKVRIVLYFDYIIERSKKVLIWDNNQQCCVLLNTRFN